MAEPRVPPMPGPGEPADWLRADELARRTAVDPRGSFLLQAPAGSGKTTVLTCRLLALLAIADSPEEVLAITFTRKAAAEMRARVLRALRRAEAGEGGDAFEAEVAAAALRRDRERGWDLLGNPARLRIQTIDSFCQRLATQLPITGGAGGRLEVALPADRLYRAATRRLLGRALDDAVLAPASQLLLERLDNNWQRLESLVQLMLAARAHWLPRLVAGSLQELPARVGAALQALVQAQLGRALALLPPAVQAELAACLAIAAHHRAHDPASTDAAAVDAGVAAWLADRGLLRASPDELPRWRLCAATALTATGGWRRALDVRVGAPPKEKDFKSRLRACLDSLAGLEGMREALVEVQALPDATLDAADSAALAALALLLQHASAELQLEFAACGRVDHPAVAAAARAALTEDGQPTDLALRCGEAIRHVLVDEFQDTSLEQFALLRALTAGWQPGDGRTLFAVGDPMQSIYQFREAEVGLFLRARDEGIGGLPLQFLELRRNFRSLPAVVEWVNAACARAFPPRDDPWLAAIEYLQSLPGREGPAGPGEAVQVHPLLTDDPGEEAARIAVLALAERRRDRHCSIAVLVPARRHAEPIAQALRGAGFGVRGVKLEPLAERAVVRDLVSLTRALLHAGDRVAWLALCRAPWCGLELPELQVIAGARGQLVWARLGDSEVLATLAAATRGRIARLHAALAPAMNGAGRALPLWQRVEQCWLRLGGPACCEGAAGLADAEAFLRALGEQEAGALQPGDAVAELVAELYAAPEGEAGAVEILTMHAAKGLEWDVVFLPAAGRSGRSDDEPLLHWLDLPLPGGEQGLLMAPIRPAVRAGTRSLGAYIGQVKRERKRIERARLLYVAATRARDRLHWLGRAGLDAKTGEVKPAAHTLLALLWPVVGGQFAAAMAHAPGAAGETGRALPAVSGDDAAASDDAAATLEESALWRLPAAWQPVGLPGPVAAERLPLSLRAPGEQPEYDWVGLSARTVGTVVHAELQRMAALPQLPAAGSLRAADYLPWLGEQGVPDAELPAAAARVVAALDATLRDERGRWLLAPPGGQAWSELRLTGLHEGKVVDITIDRMFVDAAGERWIVDYKTSTHEGGDREAFLAQQGERYAPQLQRYAAIAGAMWPGRIRLALYFPLLGEFRELALRE